MSWSLVKSYNAQPVYRGRRICNAIQILMGLYPLRLIILSAELGLPSNRLLAESQKRTWDPLEISITLALIYTVKLGLII